VLPQDFRRRPGIVHSLFRMAPLISPASIMETFENSLQVAPLVEPGATTPEPSNSETPDRQHFELL
jgi:hypothetical protein